MAADMKLIPWAPKQLTFPIEKYPTPQRLEDARQRTLLFEGIVEYGSVRKACEALGFNRSSVYLKASTDPEFGVAFKAARAMAVEMLYDECMDLADSMPTINDWGKTRLQIDTRMRVAGKLVEHLKDKPLIDNSVHNDNRQIIVSDQRRAQLQKRLQLLQESNESESRV